MAGMAKNADKPLLTAPEAAELLGVSGETVRNWMKAGTLAFITLPSGSPRVRRRDIEAILEPATSGDGAA